MPIQSQYLIRLSKGSPLTTIIGGATDTTTTSLVLHGRGAAEYGLARDQNLVYLLENFAGSPAPLNPLDGQLWWKTGSVGVLGELFVWDTQVGSPTDWKTVVPPPLALGFDVVAGVGLTGGGFPTLSPLETTLDVGEGTGITVAADSVSTNDSEIDHDVLDMFVANEHIDHSSVIIDASAGVTWGSPNDTGDATTQFVDLTKGRVLNITDSGDGITVNANDIAVDTTVVRTTGAQTIGGAKSFNAAIRGNPSNDPALPAYAFSGDINVGMLRNTANRIGFVTGGIQRFQIESDGTLFSNTAAYETLVVDDDDIPNKKYVDDSTTGAFTNPTANTFVGVNTLTGLDATQTYLVGAYGFIPSKGTVNQTLDNVTVRSGVALGLGTLLAQTPSVIINWFDGTGVTHVNFIVDMSIGGTTNLNIQINDVPTNPPDSGFGGNVYTSFIVATQLTNN